METEQAPWLFALLTAAWFGWMAHRAGRTAVLWAVGGGAFGLVISALMIGLGRASTIPFSAHERTTSQLKWLLVAVALIAAVGWLLTASLHRHAQRTRLSAESVSPSPAPSAPLPKPVSDKAPGKPGA